MEPGSKSRRGVRSLYGGILAIGGARVGQGRLGAQTLIIKNPVIIPNNRLLSPLVEDFSPMFLSGRGLCFFSSQGVHVVRDRLTVKIPRGYHVGCCKVGWWIRFFIINCIYFFYQI